ncbi:hypothetical protein SAMN04489761_1180 [Tenacibaculum sp. MAR_2009_124]|uniref:hypothetical protein n=1 Tax=Tenacibaculum sp. MAR_2009_124 TaxID=1250059 RepID=UPI00089B9DAD|nr:hypothetical protein [Tenacibaculum sp. MAR_2009_124]SEB51950.1 hypothetical protein SAMN04489761_1180 [Tenacibaculum sp. MAR_2009_124]
MKTKLFLLVILAYNYVLYAQVTYIPNNNFEAYFGGIGMTNSDVYNIFNNNTKLETLSCCDMSLTRIDISPLLHLDWLDCVNNVKVNLDSATNVKLDCTKVDPYELTSLDLSKEVKLVDRHMSNSIKSSDFNRSFFSSNRDIDITRLFRNTKLIDIYTYENQIAELEITKNLFFESSENQEEELEALYQITGNSSSNTELSTTDNPNLKFISVDDPEVSYLTNYEDDVYIYLALVDASEEIVFQNNEIDDLTGMEDFTEAWYLPCNDTNLSSVDLSNKELTTQSSSNDRLSDLNFSDSGLLEKFYVNNNFLGAIDIINLFSLKILNFYNIQLSEFDLEKGRLELLSFGK